MGETTGNNTESKFFVAPCIICGTFTQLNERETGMIRNGSFVVKVCKECKEAVAFAKLAMKNSK